MHRQLTQLLDEYRSATVRLHALRSAVPDAHWTERPAPGRWSVAECVAHLNLTSAALLPRIQQAVAAARSLGPGPGRYRRDIAGWLLTTLLSPPVRFRVASPAAFIPESLTPPSELVSDFERDEAAFVQCIREGDGFPIDQVRLRSPFNESMQYNAYSALMIVPRHQHRHLWQAEQAWAVINKGGVHGR